MSKPKNAPQEFNKTDPKPEDPSKNQGSNGDVSGEQKGGGEPTAGDAKSDADPGNPNTGVADPSAPNDPMRTRPVYTIPPLDNTAGFASPIPGIGRIVHYCLTDDDAAAVNRRREHRGGPVLGIAHVGNVAMEGDLLPMIIVAVHGDHAGSAVNGQVFLDGNDTLWVTSVLVGEGPGRFAWPQRA